MNERRKIKLIEKYLGKNAYDEIVKEMHLETYKDRKKHLIYLTDSISVSILEELVEKEILISPMLHVELINYIIFELREQGAVWNSKQDIFKLLAPKLNFSKYRSSWFDWLNPKRDDRNITKNEIKSAIEETLGFNSLIWSEPEYKQKQIVYKKVKEFMSKKETSSQKSKGIDISSLLLSEEPINTQQKQIIFKLQKSTEENIKKILKIEFEQFSFDSKNQNFLLEVLPILYDKGCYESLHTGVFPHLFPKYRERIDIKIKEANTLANLENPNYRRVIELLNSIPRNSHEEEIDITTSIISNIRRGKLNIKNVKQNEIEALLLFIIEHYAKVYQHKKPYHYYPAINLAYMIRFLEIVSPSSPEIEKYNLKKIYSSVKPSIKKEKKMVGDLSYYATISELEFLLLLDYPNIKSKIEYILDKLQPKIFLVERTLKQMEWFIDTVEQFSTTKVDTSIRFKKVIELFEDYLYYVKTTPSG